MNTLQGGSSHESHLHAFGYIPAPRESHLKPLTLRTCHKCFMYDRIGYKSFKSYIGPTSEIALNRTDKSLL